MPCLHHHKSASTNNFEGTDSSSSTSYSRIILPDNVIPEHYDLELKAYMEEFKFDGLANIHISIQKKSNSITLNAKDLNVESGILFIDEKTYLIICINFFLVSPPQKSLLTMLKSKLHFFFLKNCCMIPRL